MVVRPPSNGILAQNSWTPSSHRLFHFTVLKRSCPSYRVTRSSGARDDAHDARTVAQQRTARRTQRFPPAPRSFPFHTTIYIDVQRIEGAAARRDVSPPMLPGRLAQVQALPRIAPTSCGGRTGGAMWPAEYRQHEPDRCFVPAVSRHSPHP